MKMASRMGSKGAGVAAKKYFSSKSCSNIVTLGEDAMRKTSTVYHSEHLVIVDAGGSRMVGA